jgi:hypothetical protein
VSNALTSALPYGIGMCDNLAEVEKVSWADNGPKCISKPYLHYEKHTAYEVLARWLSGLHKMSLTDMAISVPEPNRFALSVSGRFDEIQLSLFVGQCLGSLFSSDDDNKLPACSKVFDSIHKWANVTWSIQVEADCNSAKPYVRNISVDDVEIHNPMKIEEEIAFGFSLPIDDMSEEFRKGIKESIQPILARTDGWIPWGPRKFDLVTLLSHLVELNVDSHGGTIQFKCPSVRQR